MDFEQLQTFITVVKLKSFSKAADEQFVTQPTVTNRIHSLEEELNCKLLEKNGRSFKLTKEGELFLSYATQISGQLKAAKEAIFLLKKPKIRVGVPPSFSSSIIAKSLHDIDFKSLYITILKGTDSKELIQRVLDNVLDVAFVNEPIHHDKLAMEKILDDKLVLLIHPDHYLAQYSEISKELLQNETLICYRRNTQLWNEIEEKLQGIELNKIEIHDIEMVKEFVINGWGFTILPSLTVSDKDKNLHIIEIKEFSEFSRNTYAIYQKDSPTEKIAQLFLKSIKKQISKP